MSATLKQIYNDAILSKYRFEKNLDSNDGWTKLHYTELYDKRLKTMLNEKNISTWRWWFYRWTHCKKA